MHPSKRKLGGPIPTMKDGRPDLSSINGAVVEAVQKRRTRISAPGYRMKVSGQAREEEQHRIIIKKVIRRRRPNKQDPEQAPPANGTSNQQTQQEAIRRQQEVERQRQEELQRQKQLEEQRRQQQRQQQQAAEQQRQQQDAAAAATAAQSNRQRQAAAAAGQAAAAAAAAAPPAPPTQRMATFQNLGTDPTMANAELYYESTRWAPLGHGRQITVGTFPGHRWFIVANGMYAKLFTVGEDAKQTFTF